MAKPDLLDEHLYDIVGGSVKIMKPTLLKSSEQIFHEEARSAFITRDPHSCR